MSWPAGMPIPPPTTPPDDEGLADPLGRLEPDCPFCEYAQDLVVGLAGDAYAFVIEPLNPVVPGHVLVISREHVEDFAEDIPVSMYVMRAAAMYASMHLGDCNLITSRGADATQTVRHLHVHLVPRFPGDGLKLPWSEQK